MHLPSRYCSLLLWSLRLPKPFLHYIHFNLPFEGLFFAMEFSTLLETVRFLTDKLSGHFYFMCRMKILTLNFNWSLNFSASLRKARIHFRCLRDWWECCFLEICSSSQPEPDCYWYRLGRCICFWIAWWLKFLPQSGHYIRFTALSAYASS